MEDNMWNMFKPIQTPKLKMELRAVCLKCGKTIKNTDKFEENHLGRAKPEGLSCLYEMKCPNPSCEGTEFKLIKQLW